MRQDEAASKKAWAWPSGMVGFFDAGILAIFQNQSDKFGLCTDYFEGSLTIRSEYYGRLSEPERDSTYTNVKFGFRVRKNGDLALAVWLPDLSNIRPESERMKWVPFHLQDDAFPDESDARFELWVRRYIHGDWGVDNGVLFQISEEVATINAITEMVVGSSLYEHHENPALIFPMAENDHRYQDAHREAYAYLIDGLRKPAVESLGERLGVMTRSANHKTLDALRKILPTELHAAILGPFNVVSEQRRLASHRVRPPARRCAAFEKFSHDMQEVLGALRALRGYLEGVFKVRGEQCGKRRSRIAALPEIDDTKPQSSYSISELREVVGKTIVGVEFGVRKSAPKVHETEAVILHFTDGSSLGIETGSNAGNVADEHEGLRPEAFHVDFRLTFVPSLA